MSPRLFLLPLLSSALALLTATPRAAATDAPAAISSQRLTAEITAALASHFNAEGDLQVDLLRSWTPPARTALSWQVVIAEFPSSLASTMVLRCQVLADGVLTDDTSFMVRAQLWRDVWCARQPLSSGAAFHPSDLDARRADALRERNALPATVIDSNLMFARDVPADRILTWHDIARRNLVRKGEVVDVVAGEGDLSFTMKALALQNGTSGDFIIVRNLESLRDFSGEVIDAHKVQVHF